jgi:F-type H+-transporting ATPase subunit epsilon
MRLLILSPAQEIFSGDITSVTVPGVNGRFQVLKGHAALVSALTEGQVDVVVANGDRKTWTITGGFAEVLNNEVALLVSGLKA